MLKPRNWRGLALATLATALMVWIVYGSTSFQSCINEPQNYGGNQSLKEKITALSIIINAHRDCLGRYVGEYHDAILAIFTVVLAFSTILLWVSTRDAALAAKAAAEHIPVVEGAHVYVLIKRETVEEDLQMIGIGTDVIRRDFMIEIRVSLKNFGKTPAIVERFTAILSYVFAASTKHGTEAVIQPNTIIGAGDEVPINSLIITAPHLSSAEATHIRNHEASLILHGILVYSDMWGDKWTVIFDGRNGAENEGFRLDNYPRQKKT